MSSNPFEPGHRVTWKAEPTEAEAAQIARWEAEYGPPPYEVTEILAHHEVDHLQVVTPSRMVPYLPHTFFQGTTEPSHDVAEPLGEGEPPVSHEHPVAVPVPPADEDEAPSGPPAGES